MHLICPHCHNPIEVVPLTPREEIACPSCGSSFHLERGRPPAADTSPGRSLASLTSSRRSARERSALSTRRAMRSWIAPWPSRCRAPATSRGRRNWTASCARRAASPSCGTRPSSLSTRSGQQDGVPYLVSDFVQGVTLADLLSARRPAFRESAELVAAVADALHYAHECGVVHRDVKPSNIMIDNDGKPSVMDFGLAKREAGEITHDRRGPGARHARPTCRPSRRAARGTASMPAATSTAWA